MLQAHGVSSSVQLVSQSVNQCFSSYFPSRHPNHRNQPQSGLLPPLITIIFSPRSLMIYHTPFNTPQRGACVGFIGWFLWLHYCVPTTDASERETFFFGEFYRPTIQSTLLHWANIMITTIHIVSKLWSDHWPWNVRAPASKEPTQVKPFLFRKPQHCLPCHLAPLSLT